MSDLARARERLRSPMGYYHLDDYWNDLALLTQRLDAVERERRELLAYLQRIWDTVPASFMGAEAEEHARVLNGIPALLAPPAPTTEPTGR